MVAARSFRLVATFLLAAFGAQTPMAESRRSHLVEEAPVAPAWAALCGTDLAYLQSRGLVRPLALASGDPLMANQDPRILTPDHTEPFSVTIQVVGDHSTFRFERSATDAAESKTETWSRTSTRTVRGRLVSIFRRSYPATELAGTLRRQAWGFDDGGLVWGDVIAPGSGTRHRLTLRIGSTNIPAAASSGTRSTVVLADDVQWAGSVVNIQVPGFGDSRVADGAQDFDLVTAARKFYEHFPDAYDSIAFVPQGQAFLPRGALHVNVQNNVRGIGLETFNDSADYGSRGRLKSVEVYPQTSFTTHEMSNHQIMHQWGHYLDLVGIAGVQARGFDPGSHTPLTEGTTTIGATLEATREVVQTTNTPTPQAVDFEIRRAQHPILFHPLEMYVLGKISVEALGTQLIFDDQAQFGDGRSAPAIGTRLRGGVTEVTTGAILGQHGSRGGPSPAEWRRATVVVSREALLSEQEMNYWNFFAQRLADPDRTGVPSYDGYVSFDAATQNTVDLRTDVAPAGGGGAGSAVVEVTRPELGRRDWPGVEFDTKVPSRFVVNQNVRLSGRVTATDRTDFDKVLIRFWKSDGTSEDAVRVQVSLTRSGTFTADFQFSNGQRGLYSMDVFLLWPDAGPQFPRARLTPILVE